MRRVFPLRPAETSLLVTYDNGAFELHQVDASGPLPPPSSVPKNRRRSRSTDFSLPSSSSSPPALTPPLQKVPLPSEYPEFVDTGSPSSRSSLWTSGVLDDGDSTSFNSSFGTHRRHASHFSTSSSSSINFNPADSGSHCATSPRKAVEPYRPNISSSPHASAAQADTKNAPSEDLKVNLRVKTRPSHLEPPAGEASMCDSTSWKSQEFSLPETPTYVIPRQVEEYMQKCLDMPPNGRHSRPTASKPKVSDRPCEPQLGRQSESSRRAPPKPPLQRKDEDRCSCSVPFKYITKCLKRDKRNTSVHKEENSRPPNPSTKYSTSLNGLFNPSTPSKAKSQLDNERGRQIHSKRADPTGRDGRYSDLSTRPCSAFKADESMNISDDDWGSSSACKSFGPHMVDDYVKHLQHKPKSLSFRNNPGPVSFHNESDSGGRPRSASVDVAKRFIRQAGDNKVILQELPGQRLRLSSAKPSRQRPNSLDMPSPACGGENVCSSKGQNDSSAAAYDWTSDLQLFDEKNMRIITLLKLEISKLSREKSFLAKELAAEMNAHHCQRKTAESAVRDVEAEMEERLISVEKDHALSKARLQQEMDRRAEEWCAKLRKIRIEEKKLKDRLTKMALERVELQKVIALHKSREASLQVKARDHETSAQTWMQRHHQADEEVLLLRKSLRTACNKLEDKDHALDLLLQTSKALERENVALCQEFGKLSRAYEDQEVMFRDMLQRLVAILNGPSDSKVESLKKLRGEVKAFGEQEQALRNEIDVLQSQLLQTKQRVLTSADGSDSASNRTLFSPGKRFGSLHALDEKYLGSTEEFMKKMEHTRQRARQLECQLDVKEEQTGLLHSALNDRENAVREVQDELTSVKAQRDCLRKQVQQMNQEALKLNGELDRLRKVVEKLDDELMLKEGEMSIMRSTCSDSDFFE